MSEEQPQEPQENTNQPINPAPQQSAPQMGHGFNYGMQHSLPNATPVLVLGILSIVTCCCYGVIGLILAIVALILSKKDRALYAANMMLYTESSYKNLNAGRVCAIIGLTLNILIILISIAFVAIFGWAALNDQDEIRRILEGYQ
ncbi:MAG TPA: CCC motif membrane protein [Pedobacter sp.]|nr:CCC motif membrane protein [Pedobacter sp.]